MAEGGSSDQDDNPFSFQKFVKKKSKDKSDDDSEAEEEADIFDLPDVSTPVKKTQREQVLTDNGENPARKKNGKKNPDENPFSFKKFLKSSGEGARPKGYSRSRNGLAAPDFASDLPDFVQDHYSDVAAQERLQLRDPLELPDFALDTSVDKHSRQSSSQSTDGFADDLEVIGNRTSESDLLDPHLDPHLDLHLANGSAHGQPPDINSFNLDPGVIDSVSDGEISDTDDGPQLASSLPDFLPDGAIGSADSPGITVQVSGGRNVAAFQINGDLELELRRVREENRRLRTQVDEQTVRLSEANQRIETIQKREAEDTAALEKMVHQVEANLVTTTQRAVLAESTVTKLKQEVKTLEAKLKLSKGDNQAQSGDQMLTSIRERTKYASEQLSTAAKNAEQTLKQLLSGVDSMKLLAEVLASIDKITDSEPPDGAAPSGGGAQGGQS